MGIYYSLIYKLVNMVFMIKRHYFQTNYKICLILENKNKMPEHSQTYYRWLLWSPEAIPSVYQTKFRLTEYIR